MKSWPFIVLYVITTIIYLKSPSQKIPACRQAGLSDKGFALLIQIISYNFAHIKSNPHKWDFLTGLHKK